MSDSNPESSTPSPQAGAPSPRWGRLAATAVGTVAAVYLTCRIYKVLLLFYLAMLLGMAFNCLILYLERRKVSRTIAVAGLAVIFIAGLVAAGFWVIPPAAAQAQVLADHTPDYMDRAQRWVNGIFSRYPEIRQEFAMDATSLQKLVPKSTGLLQRFGSLALGLGGALFSAFLLFFLIVYGLINPQPMARALFDLTPTRIHDRMERTLERIQEKVVAWAGGTLILMAIVGVMVYVGLLVIGAPQALLFGILAGVGEGIPTLGPILSAIPPVAVMLLTDPVRALWVVALFVGVQQLENNLLVPMIMGNRLNVHPWALIFMLLVMGELFGVVGVFLATPTTAILGVIYEELVPKPGQRDVDPAGDRVARVLGGEQKDPVTPRIDHPSAEA